MFCRQCGSEIPNEARFCTFLGTKAVTPMPREDEGLDPSKTDGTTDVPGKAATDDECADQSTNGSAAATEEKPTVQTNNADKTSEAESATNATSTTDGPSDTAADAETARAQVTNAMQEQSDARVATAQPEANSLKAAVEQNKKRSRRHMPMILLVALALALATSVVYAAYRVYNDVWLPYQAEQEQLAKHPLKDADGDTITAEVSGNPKNALQIADLMMMDPTAIPDFLDEQGLGYDSVYANGRWSIEQFSYLDNAYEGSFDNSLFGAPDTTSLYIGSDTSIVSPHSLGAVANKRMLESGTKPAGVMVVNLPISFDSNEDEISQFCEKANLGKPLEKFATSGTPINGGSPQSYNTWVYTGIASSKNDEKILWYMSANNEDGQVLFGCLKLDKAYDLVSGYGLYSKDQWESADNREKAKIAAQSLSQEYWGSYYFRVNVITGAVEFDSGYGNWKEGKPDKGGFVSPWTGEVFFDSDIGSCFADSLNTETTDL